jgi:hypothetical protein
MLLLKPYNLPNSQHVPMTRLQQLTTGLGFVCMHIFVDCWITLPILVSIERVIDG